MKHLILILLAPLALAATACSTGTVDSSQVSASSIHEEYSVTYSSDSNQMNFWAQFRVGDSTGTTVHLSSPAQLLVNNKGVNASNFLGTYYSMNYGSGFMSSTNVVYTDSTGASHTYVATLTPINYAGTVNPSVSTTTNLVIPLQGSSLASGESITATIYQNAQSQTNPSPTIFGTYDASMNRIVFKNTDLQTLQAGVAATLDVSRTRSASFASGYMQMVYDAGQRPLQITP